MAFVKFTETGKSFTPKVSISNRGMIGFNQGAKNRFELDKYTVCILYYDKDEQKVGFEFSTDEQTEGAIRLRHREIGADIGAKSFLAYFDIVPEATMLYQAKAGEKPGWLVVDLKSGKQRKSSKGQEDDAEEDEGDQDDLSDLA